MSEHSVKANDAVRPEGAAVANARALTKKGEPRCAQPWWYARQGWQARVAELGVWALIYALVMLIAPWAGINPSSGAIMFIGIVAAWSVTVWFRWALYGRYMERLLDKAFEHELALCLRCGYSLTGLPTRHRCPECGCPYQVSETRRLWERWLASDRTGQVSQSSLESIRQSLADAKTMRERSNCVRCGHDIREFSSRVCPECGATHKVERNNLFFGRSEGW